MWRNNSVNSFINRKHNFQCPIGWQLCSWCGQLKESYLHYAAPKGFEPIETAPKNATNIEIILSDGKIIVARWMQDLSGECCPPYAGWFTKFGQGTYTQIDEPSGWRPLKDSNHQ